MKLKLYLPRVVLIGQYSTFEGSTEIKATFIQRGLWDVLWGILGGFWEASGVPWEVSWVVLGVSWGVLGTLWGCHDASWGSPGAVWGCLGSLLGCVWEGFLEIIGKLMENLRKFTGSTEIPKKFIGKLWENHWKNMGKS